MEIIIQISVVAMFIELLLIRWWVPVYFRKGIPLFKKSFLFNEEQSFSSTELHIDLSVKFHRTILPPIIFRNISDHEIAFRESFLRFPISRISIGHGLIRIDNIKREVTLIGYPFWSIFCLIFFFILFIITDPLHLTHLSNRLGLLTLFLVIIFIDIKFTYRLYFKIYKYLEIKYLESNNNK